MEGKPDLIIGNYTDGNLVASLMASKLGVTQVEIIYGQPIESFIFFFFLKKKVKLCDTPNGLVSGDDCTCSGEDKV
jgi:hypothetical protein